MFILYLYTDGSSSANGIYVALVYIDSWHREILDKPKIKDMFSDSSH